MGKSVGRAISVKSSALRAARVGAAVCLSATDASAAWGTGEVKIAKGAWADVLGGKVRFSNLDAVLRQRLYGVLHSKVISEDNTYVYPHGQIVVARLDAALQKFPAGQLVRSDEGAINHWVYDAFVDGTVKKDENWFIKVRFLASTGTYYGWSRFWTEGTLPNLTFCFGSWSYNSTAYYPILTLGESTTASRLVLSDGKALLHFVSANEEGVASYAIEVGKDGGWEKIVSFVPGDGHYSFAANAGAAHRLVTERVDGTRSHVAF